MFIIDKKENLIDYSTKKFIEIVQRNKQAKFILPTGNAPIEMYGNICEENNKGNIDLSEIKTYNLDEYTNDKELNPEGILLKKYMKEKLFDKTNIDESNTFFPNDVNEFDSSLEEAGAIDIAYLGLGVNGHIGFNEPGSEVIRTNIANLTPETRQAISAKKNIPVENTPSIALTMGLKDIIERSDVIIIMAWGEAKIAPLLKLKEAIKNNEVDKNWPVTNLINHKNLIVLTDQWLD